jgi:ATP-dependent RNA helicase SUPV3L1/SUV3
MIFESTLRISDGRPKPLPPSDIKQIGGRAGRFRVAPSISIKSADTTTVTEVSPDMAPQRPKSDEQTLISNDDVAEKKRLGVSDKTLGLVTSLHPFDLKFIERAMSATATPIISAGILPPDNVVVRFASYFPPRTPFSYILLRLHEISRMQSRFRLCQVSDGVEVADVIQSLEGLSIPDRLTFCAAPISLRDAGSAEIVKAYARCVEQQTEGALLDFSVLDLEMLDDNGPPTSNKLYKLELLHKALILYLWLSYRFSGIFTSQAMAFHVKKLVEDNIDKALESRPYNKLTSARFRKLKEMDLFLEQSHEEMNALYPNDTSEAATRLKQRAAVERDELFVLGKQGDIALKPVSSKIEVDQLTKL